MPSSLPEPPPSDAGKQTITVGLVLLGGALGAAVGSVYSWRERNQRIEQLEQLEENNAIIVANGGMPDGTADLRDEIQLYRGLTIGLAATAGVLALVGGGVALAGLRTRQRAARITMHSGGLAVQF